jgi:hypothetical protein
MDVAKGAGLPAQEPRCGQVRTNDAFCHQLLDVFDALIAPTFAFLKREAGGVIGLI